MKTIGSLMALVVLLVSLAGCAPAAPADTTVWPSGSWIHAQPSQQGMDAAKLAQGLSFIGEKGLKLHSLVVVRNGTLVTTAYFHPYEQSTPMRIQSITKSVMGMLVGIAIDKGYIKSVDQKVVDFFPGRNIANLDARKQAITLKHLLTMTSGLDCDDGQGSAGEMMASSGWIQYALDRPMADAPGTKFRYCSAGSHLLSAILEKTTGKDVRTFANEVLFAPLNIPAVEPSGWSVDPQGYPDGSSGLRLTPENIARLGWLYVTGGKWAGQQIVSARWVSDSLKAYTDKGDGSSYGYLWTVYPDQDHAAALGMGAQQLHVYPKQKLVVVLTASLPVAVQAPEVETLLKEHILASIGSSSGTGGEQQLQEAVAKASAPQAQTPALPEVAGRISGKTYRLDENPLGYQTVRLNFEPGSSTGEAVVNDLPPFRVGLDGLYRSNDSPAGSAWLRGTWLDGKTFQLEQITPGELADVISRVVFDGDRITFTVNDGVFGGEMFKMEGKME